MHFPKYWAWGEYAATDRRGRTARYYAWGWSDTSEADARSVAMQRAKRSFDTLQRDPNAPPAPHDPYLYGDGRPFREVVLEEHAGGEAIVSRNRIGCDVLNTAKLGFVDVDYEDFPSSGGGGGLFGLFNKGPRLTPGQRAQTKALELLQTWLAAHPEDHFRIYETAAGLRYLLTSRELEPKSAEADELLRALGSDGRYRKLCIAQDCFRARLSPKPWRAVNPKGKWDMSWSDPADQDANSQLRDKAHENYLGYSSAYATCRFKGAVGSGIILPAFEPLIALHDERTKAESGLPLA